MSLSRTITDSEDPLFCLIETRSLSRGLLEDLISGRVAAIKIAGFLSENACRSFVGALDDGAMRSYNPSRFSTPMRRLGPVASDYRVDGHVSKGYWTEATEAETFWRDLDPTVNVRWQSLANVSIAWGNEIRAARAQGAELYWGVIREINGGLMPHWDDWRREHPSGFFEAIPLAQIAFNAYLSLGVVGGQTHIWRRQWQPGDEKYRSGYGYTSDLDLSGGDELIVACSVGDALLFCPRYIHSVSAVEKGARRIALAFFVGFTVSGQLTVWS
jgi:hypothetical protein